MPQMAPLMWLMLFLVFIFTFLMFNILNYFNFIKFNKNPVTNNENPHNFTELNWKW